MLRRSPLWMVGDRCRHPLPHRGLRGPERQGRVCSLACAACWTLPCRGPHLSHTDMVLGRGRAGGGPATVGCTLLGAVRPGPGRV